MDILIIISYLFLPMLIISGVYYLFRWYKEQRLERKNTHKINDLRSEEVSG